MRKVLIVTLSVVYLKGLLYCVMYAMLFVDTVDMKIKVCNALNSVCYLLSQHWCLWLLHNTVYRVMRYENSTLLGINWYLAPARREGYLLFEKPSVLGV